MICGLTSCSIDALYSKKDGDVEKELSSIYVATIADRQGQILRNKLVQLLSPYGGPKERKYILKIKFRNNFNQLGILKDATSSLTQNNYYASFELMERCTRKVVFSSQVEMTSYYHTIPGSPFSTLTEADFSKRGIAERIAYDIRRKLAAYFFLQFSKKEKILRDRKVDSYGEKATGIFRGTK